MSDGQNIRACEVNCFTCAFKYNFGKKKIPYCALKRFAILNPDIGCSRRITKGELKSNCIKLNPEEIAAAKDANRQNKWEI